MKLIFLKLLTIKILFILLINSTFAQENKILFKIDNNIVTTIDIYNEIKYLQTINAEQLQNIDNIKIFEIAKNSLIREKIKEIELLKNFKKIEINKKYLDQILINYFKKKNISSKDQFNKYFESINLLPSDIEKKITIEILWNQLIYRKFYQNVKINEEEIKKNIKKNKRVKEYLVSEILFNVENDEILEKKIKLIQSTIFNSNFSNAALLYSNASSAKDGGELGWIKETSMNDNIKKEISKIKKGGITEPMVVPGGFLIIQIKDERIVELDTNISKEFEIIVKKKTNDQLNQFSNIYFNKIKKNILINEL